VHTRALPLCASVRVAFSPLPLVASFTALIFTYELYTQLASGMASATAFVVSCCFFPVLNTLSWIIELLLVLGLKWLLVGKYKEGNYPFYGVYHLTWVVMMVLMETVDNVLDLLAGTPFAVWVYRMFGAHIGEGTCLMGSPLEFDLLHVADRGTVERMVIKLAPVTVGKGGTMRNASMLMPGATLGERASILELSQVLKGEAAGAGEVWAGLPAQRVA
jgi:hypothetical protein